MKRAQHEQKAHSKKLDFNDKFFKVLFQIPTFF